MASEELRARHRANRVARHAARAAGALRAPLDQQSRADTAERRRFDAIYAPQPLSRMAAGLAAVGDELALVAEHSGLPIESDRLLFPFRVSVRTMIGTTVIEAQEFRIGEK